MNEKELRLGRQWIHSNAMLSDAEKARLSFSDRIQMDDSQTTAWLDFWEVWLFPALGNGGSIFFTTFSSYQQVQTIS